MLYFDMFGHALGPVHIIPGQLIAPGQLTDPGGQLCLGAWSDACNYSRVLRCPGATSRGGLSVVQHRVTCLAEVKATSRSTPVMVIIPLNFARCTLPTHINR